MSRRLGKCLAGALVALAVTAVPLAGTANAQSRPLPTLKDCAALSAAAHRSFYERAGQRAWRNDSPQGGCIQVAQHFINDVFTYATFFAARSATAAHQLSGVDLGWWRMREDGDFGPKTTRAVKAYAQYNDLGANMGLPGYLTHQLLENMTWKCWQARQALNYQTTACPVPVTGSPNRAR